MKLLFTTSLLLALTGMASATTLTYTADNTTDFPNPERGFYAHTERHVTAQSTTTDMTARQFEGAREENMTLMLRFYYFEKFRKADLPDNVLSQITADLNMFRQNGCKAILRFGYDNDNDDGYQDASLTWWLRHLDQLKPILAANADVIYVVQAGFLGVWGEWYFSSCGTGDGIPQSTKNSLLDKLLECVPASRFVQVRTPNYKRAYTGATAAMTSTDAYQNTKKGRLGHHNDAFLVGESNLGTYDNRYTDMNYLAQECLYVPNGGENCITDEDTYKDWGTGAKAKAEMAKLHYSYLNSDYSKLPMAHWQQDGSYDELSRNMGYRYQLTTATLPDSGAVGKIVNVQLQLQNVGYAPLYNERHAYIVFKNSSKTYSVQLATDPRTWLPNSAVTAIGENISLPSDMAAGTYHMYLWLPDASASIANDPKFAIRFANSDIWDDNTGYNDLNASIIVTQTGGDRPGPGPTPPPAPIPDTCTVQIPLSPYQVDESATASASVSIVSDVMTVLYETTEAWATATVDFPIATRSDVVSLTLSYKSTYVDPEQEQWSAMYIYVSDGAYQYVNDYYMDNTNICADNEWHTVTIEPNLVLWEDTPASIEGVAISSVGLIINPMDPVSSSLQVKDIILNVHCPTAIESAQDDASPVQKFIHQGHLYIRSNGQVYNALGLRHHETR